MVGLLLSVPKYKELGSSHFHLYNEKKPEKTENQQFLDPLEIWGLEQTITLKSRKVNPENQAEICLPGA